MKILLVTEYFPKNENKKMLGGVQVRTYYVSKYLQKRHTISVTSLDQGSIEATTASILRRLQFSLKTALSTPQPKPDIIEASNVTAYIPAYLLGKRLHIPVVVWIPDVIGFAQWRRYFSLPVALVGSLIEEISLRLPFSGMIAMSQSTKEKIRKRGVMSEQISVVYGGVEVEKVNKMKVEKNKRPTICAIARLVSYKRLEDLLNALPQIKTEIEDIQCVIIGDGPERNNLQNQINRLRLTQHVTLLGSLSHEETLRRLKQSHVFCLPSLVEGFGIVTVEAMAAGIPYVSSRIKPTVEITHGGRGGLLFSPKDSSDLAKNVIRLLKDEVLYENKKQQGLKLARSFDWSIIAQQTLKAYQQAVTLSN